MFFKYSLGIQALYVICLIGWITFIPQFFCATTTCPPPDFPKGGNYTPVYTEYEVGMKVSYDCNENFTRFGEDRITCQSTGRWFGITPFCDSPVKLKNPTATKLQEGSLGAPAITDGRLNTCVTTGRGTSEFVRVYLDRPAAVFAVIMYLPKGRSTFTISLFSEDGHSRSVPCASHNAELAENDWVPFSCKTNDVKAKYITVQVSDGKASAISLCEIEVYTKDDTWCQEPPDNFLPHSQLEVSRSRADFKCNAGFKPNNKRIYASCESNRWSRLPVQCEEILCVPLPVKDSSEGMWEIDDKPSKLSVGTKSTLKCKTGYHTEGEPTTVTCLHNGTWNRTKAICKQNKRQKDSTAIIAGVGTVVVLIIFILLGLTIYFVRKKSREVVVIYKPSEGNSYSSPPSVGGQSIAGLSEAEYSTVYYEAIQNNQFDPRALPPKPPNLDPKLDRGYSKPVDDRSTYNTTPTNQNPTELAFGTLTKSSSLYSSMN